MACCSGCIGWLHIEFHEACLKKSSLGNQSCCNCSGELAVWAAGLVANFPQNCWQIQRGCTLWMSQLSCCESGAPLKCLLLMWPSECWGFKGRCKIECNKSFFIPIFFHLTAQNCTEHFPIDFPVGGCSEPAGAVLGWGCGAVTVCLWGDGFVTTAPEHSARSSLSQKMSVCNQHLISHKSSREACAGFPEFPFL